MPTITRGEKAAQGQEKAKRKANVRAKKSAPRLAEREARPATPPALNKLRSRLGLTQAEFARLVPASVRTLASLEGGTLPTESIARRLVELGRLTGALSEVIKPDALGKWLLAPNPAFDGLKPLEVIERGESDRLWEMIYFLRSGVPS